LSLGPVTVHAQAISAREVSGPAAPGEWLEVAHVENMNGPGECTGTLVSPNEVLFAAHCVLLQTFQPALERASHRVQRLPVVDRQKVARIMIDELSRTTAPEGFRANIFFNAVNENDRARMTKRTARGFFLQPQTLGQLPARQKKCWTAAITTRKPCANELFSPDVAMLRLDRPVPEDIPHTRRLTTALWNKYIRVGTEGVLVGFGRQSHEKLQKRALRARIIDTQCKANRCARGKEFVVEVVGEGSFCGGDSGGPLIVDTPEGRFVAGIGSRGDMREDRPLSNCPGLPFIFSRVDPYTDNWIRN
jgi:hypothetical protein